MGGADRSVTVWDVESGRILYKVRGAALCPPQIVRSDECRIQLPGHKGTVTCVEFHPKEPIGAYPYCLFGS